MRSKHGLLTHPVWFLALWVSGLASWLGRVLDGPWPRWVGNLANVAQLLGGLIAAVLFMRSRRRCRAGTRR